LLGLASVLAAWDVLPAPGRAQLPPPPPAEGEQLPPEPPGTPGPSYGGPADPPTPAVSVHVRVPATAAPGKELEYRIGVENRSAAAANHVEVRSTVPAHAEFVKATPEPIAAPTKDSPKLAWKLGTLGPGARREITLVLKPDGTGDVDACARVVFEHGQCVRTKVARPDVRLRRTGPSQAALNDLVTYRLEVTNAGAAEATDVVLSDLLPDGLSYSTSNPSTSGENPLTWKLGKLAPGQTRRVEYQVIAEKRGTFEDKATVSVDGKVVQESSGKVVVGEPDLEVVVTGPKRRTLDRPAVYRITVSNPGTLPAANVQVVDDLFHEDVSRERVEFLGASAGGRLVGRDVRWALGTLPAGARRTVELTLRARREGKLDTVVRASADRGLTARGGATTEFDAAAGLTLDIDKDRDPLPVGGEAVLTLRLRNRTAAAAKVTELRVTLPDQLKVARVSGPGTEAPDKQTVTFAPPAAVAAGAEAVFAIAVRGQKPGTGPIRTELSTEALAGGAPAAPDETATVLPEGPAKKEAKGGDKP
jgi:uncharacterized repeat protein (TIGR01451 family)